MKATGLGVLLKAFTCGWGVALIVCAFVLRQGRAPFQVPATLPVVLLVVTLAILGWGLRVKASRRKDTPERHRNHELSPLYAARVAVMAQACSRGAASFVGFFAMVALLFARTGQTSYVHTQVLMAILSAGASLLLVCVSWLVERWCIVDNGSDSSATA